MTPPNAMEGAGQLFCQMVSWSSAVAPLVRIQTGQMFCCFFAPPKKKAKCITHTSIYALFTKIILDTWQYHKNPFTLKSWKANALIWKSPSQSLPKCTLIWSVKQAQDLKMKIKTWDRWLFCHHLRTNQKWVAFLDNMNLCRTDELPEESVFFGQCRGLFWNQLKPAWLLSTF